MANEWNAALAEMQRRFPKTLEKYAGFTGESHERNKLIRANVRKYYENRYTANGYDLNDPTVQGWIRNKVNTLMSQFNIRSNNLASSWRGNMVSDPCNIDQFKGIVLNRDTMGDMANLTSSATNSEAAMFHPIGSGDSNAVAAILDHEFGHLLDYDLDLRSNPEMIQLYDDCLKAGMEMNLSGYAEQEGIGEFVAEAWSEYNTNPKPRDTARKVGELIEREYRKRYGSI